MQLLYIACSVISAGVAILCTYVHWKIPYYVWPISVAAGFIIPLETSDRLTYTILASVAGLVAAALTICSAVSKGRQTIKYALYVCSAFVLAFFVLALYSTDAGVGVALVVSVAIVLSGVLAAGELQWT